MLSYTAPPKIVCRQVGLGDPKFTWSSSWGTSPSGSSYFSTVTDTRLHALGKSYKHWFFRFAEQVNKLTIVSISGNLVVRSAYQGTILSVGVHSGNRMGFWVGGHAGEVRYKAEVCEEVV